MEIITQFKNLVEMEIIMDQILCISKQEILELNNLLENIVFDQIDFGFRVRMCTLVVVTIAQILGACVSTVVVYGHPPP